MSDVVPSEGSARAGYGEKTPILHGQGAEVEGESADRFARRRPDTLGRVSQKTQHCTAMKGSEEFPVIDINVERDSKPLDLVVRRDTAPIGPARKEPISSVLILVLGWVIAGLLGIWLEHG